VPAAHTRHSASERRPRRCTAPGAPTAARCEWCERCLVGRGGWSAEVGSCSVALHIIHSAVPGDAQLEHVCGAGLHRFSHSPRSASGS
jgi:hypothetical protein